MIFIVSEAFRKSRN